MRTSQGAAALGSGYADLSPVNYLLRAANVFRRRPAVRGEKADFTYAELLERRRRPGKIQKFVLRERG